jgi:DNA-binding transcriptional LysR family regulator
MNGVYERDLDLNLLRVFAVVAEESSVTRAAARLYLTQPAVSAALRRLAAYVGAELFARQGRGLQLTSRGAELVVAARQHLGPLVAAAMAPPTFDPKSSTATVRLGLSESTEGGFLPPLLALLRKEAPAMQLIVLPVQFRTVEAALLSRQVDLAVCIADEMPRSILRQALLEPGGFVCVYDPRFLRLPKVLTEKEYFAHEHVVVSYAGDVRGIVEDLLGRSRTVRVSVPAFSYVGAVVEGSPLLATLPELVARQMLPRYPRLRALPVPLQLSGTSLEMLWLRLVDEDPVSRFARGLVTKMMLPFASEGAAPSAPKPDKAVRAARARRRD